jgi:PAS domain-containing protein
VQLRALDSRTTGEQFTEDFRLRRADGTIRRLHAAGRADRDPDGHIHRLHGIAVDVTERNNEG